ncbi:hypothetical protein [Allocoleopsis franciscana]|uniref:Uncharacterized protein n=1 Tax=Allocoleopsis franciscana PCC 7113 TaxID=1173027 RepID=K9WHY4_9CYAN|nr:hypothetical protein [Allocoleopsis franciscana]AFZ19112.1 hypothetical protein Mic7113_3381 [Allocoleopsis franciscana PCC 7113]
MAKNLISWGIKNHKTPLSIEQSGYFLVNLSQLLIQKLKEAFVQLKTADFQAS